MTGAFPGVTIRRSLAQVMLPGRSSPLIVDLVKVRGGGAAKFDLPLHYAGHLIDTDVALKSNLAERPVLGKANGYQHLWVDAIGAAEQGRVTWITDGRFYSYRFATPGASLILAESGANDAKFNLRREPVVIQRVEGSDPTFISLLEPHGRYDASAETTIGSMSSVTNLSHRRSADADVVVISFRDGGRAVIAFADDVAASAKHRASIDGKPIAWVGHVGRADWPIDGAAK